MVHTGENRVKLEKWSSECSWPGTRHTCRFQCHKPKQKKLFPFLTLVFVTFCFLQPRFLPTASLCQSLWPPGLAVFISLWLTGMAETTPRCKWQEDPLSITAHNSPLLPGKNQTLAWWFSLGPWGSGPAFQPSSRICSPTTQQHPTAHSSLTFYVISCLLYFTHAVPLALNALKPLSPSPPHIYIYIYIKSCCL